MEKGSCYRSKLLSLCHLHKCPSLKGRVAFLSKHLGLSARAEGATWSLQILSVQVALLLIDQDPEVAGTPAEDGTTLLMKACEQLMLPVVKRLLDLGMDPGAPDKTGKVKTLASCP